MIAVRNIAGLFVTVASMACGGTILLTGCAGSSPGKGDVYCAVSAPQAQVYRFGPSQPTGADALLTRGDRVIMLRQEYGYSRVMTENGLTGFVANDFISPAPPPPKPAALPGAAGFANLPPLPSRGTGIPGVSSANRAIIESGPLFGEDPLPPLPDSEGTPPAKGKAPGFRFNVKPPSTGSPDQPAR